MFVISSSYGNDSIALIQLVKNMGLDDVIVAHVNTGWGSVDYESRVSEGQDLARFYGFDTVTIKPELNFPELMKHKKGFPNGVKQWCSGLLKGIPFLNWIDGVDPELKATVLIGKRRSESFARANIPEIIEESEYHGGRKVWHPLYAHDEKMRNDLVRQSGMDLLPHRSQECQPCVNLSKAGLRIMKEADIKKCEQLEQEVGQFIFRPNTHGNAEGIREVIKWAKYGTGAYKPGQEDLFDMGCGSPFGCGL